MRIEKSPLEFLGFLVLKHNYSFMPCEPGADNSELFQSYEIDLDYQILKPKEDRFQVFVKTKINSSKSPLPGYSLFVEGVAIYSIPSPPAIDEKDRNSLIKYSSVSIAINCLRDYIASSSSSWPMGKYILPAIDLNKLIADKAKLLLKKKTIKNSSSSNPETK